MTSAGVGDAHRHLSRPLDAAQLHIDVVDPTAVRQGRRFVEAQLSQRGATELRDDVALSASELLANAVQHGLPPVSVSVAGDASRIRIEVADQSPRPPLQPLPSRSNMTGRGIALVAAAATRWGVEQGSPTGKVVWAEFEPGMDSFSGAGPALQELGRDWESEEAESGGQLYTVVLGDVPTDLLMSAKAHIDNVVREFRLALEGEGHSAPPADLARTIETVVHGFADARDLIKRQALAASQRGEVRTKLILRLPASAANAGEAYLRALDDADQYSRAARLLTLESPAPHRLFRRWYVTAVVNQLRQLAADSAPRPVEPFDTLMLREIERLASLQRVTDRSARLQRLTAALAQARTLQDVAEVVVSEGVTALGAAGGGLLLPAEDGLHITVPGTVGYADELVDALREERLDAPLPGATALRTGQPVWLESQLERDQLFPALRGFEADVVSMCAIPLTVAERTVGALRFSFESRKLFDQDEREFVLALAAQTAQTLARTEAYARERRASLALQRALLPQSIPAMAGWHLAAHYSPAGEQEAGGDFYDVLELTDGRYVVVVGDVMGRGLQAAASMSQVRATIRAYAIQNPDPIDVFSKLDRFFSLVDTEQLVTVLYLLVQPDTGHVLLASAGHLPPIAFDPTGAHVPHVEEGLAFGVAIQQRPPASQLTVPPGGGLVIFTDGLVERRREDIDVGINRVKIAIAGGACSSADEVLARVAAEASDPGGNVDDDVTAIALCRK